MYNSEINIKNISTIRLKRVSMNRQFPSILTQNNIHLNESFNLLNISAILKYHHNIYSNINNTKNIFITSLICTNI